MSASRFFGRNAAERAGVVHPVNDDDVGKANARQHAPPANLPASLDLDAACSGGGTEPAVTIQFHGDIIMELC